MKLTNKDKVIIDKFNEKMKENGVDTDRVFIEFAYWHCTDFSKYVTGVANGDIELYLK